MAKNGISVKNATTTESNDSEKIPQARGSFKPSVSNKGNCGSSPKLQGLDSNPQGEFRAAVLAGISRHLAHIYTLSLPDPSEEARFTLSTRTYPRPRDPDALSGHGVHHDAGARSGRARRRPAAHLSPARRLVDND